MGETSKPGVWSTITIVMSLISGGAMGSLITHYYATRQTVVNYSINTTSLGAAEATKSVLPSLKLQLDNIEIPAVYTHTIEISHGGGPELDQALVSITLNGAKLYGSPVASGPDPLHQISCKYEQPSLTTICSIGRITPKKGPYRITLATDRTPTMALAIDGRNTTIEQSSIPSTGKWPSTFLDYAIFALAGASVLSLLIEKLSSVFRKIA